MLDVHFAVVDVETTGLTAPDAEVIEIGVTDLAFNPETKAVVIGSPCAELFRPERPIPPEAKAVHHLTEAMLADKAVATEANFRAMVGGSTFVAAHNFAMEAQWLTPEILGDIRPICTFKCARRIWTDAPGYSNQVLRYWLDLPVDPVKADPPHRAGADTHVTAHLLAVMLKTERVRDLVAWTLAPTYYHVCPIGKHKGQAWSVVPGSYLQWMIGAPEMEADIVHAAKAEMEFRRHGGA